MSTSKTSTTDFDKKVDAIALVPSIDHTWAKRFSELWDISIPLAISLKKEWITELSDAGVEEINRCFVALCDVFDKTEEELLSYLDGEDETFVVSG